MILDFQLRNTEAEKNTFSFSLQIFHDLLRWYIPGSYSSWFLGHKELLIILENLHPPTFNILNEITDEWSAFPSFHNSFPFQLSFFFSFLFSFIFLSHLSSIVSSPLLHYPLFPPLSSYLLLLSSHFSSPLFPTLFCSSCLSIPLHRHTRHPPHQSQSHSIHFLSAYSTSRYGNQELKLFGDTAHTEKRLSVWFCLEFVLRVHHTHICISVIKTELIYVENSIGYIRVFVILRET